ncbi:uncharacterized protein LOC113850524 [Abrus precatorius]|uniref:Uncharacterized protein LOC113850524 n=1 Tax=Abrus precatorius TaxID=3816 RepID=A0A8B8K084_ABRPR|nr:uncharacterized protein LOC113850524 [Abrus precatorius]
MARSFGFEKQCYADDGMWKETESQEEGYAFLHQESWSSDNNYHKQFPNMPMKKPGAFAMVMESELSISKPHGKLGGGYNAMFEEGMHGGRYGFGYAHGGNKKYPFGGTNTSHQFANGGAKFNSGGHNEFFLKETDYEIEASVEEHVDEMRYERQNWGGDGYFLSHDRNRLRKPYGGHKVEWTMKGV